MSIYDLFEKKDFYETLPLKVYDNLLTTEKKEVRDHFVYQSNLIEGISYFPYGKTMSIEELEKFQKEGPLEVPVWNNHLRALDYVFDNFLTDSLNNLHIRRTHRILTKDFEKVSNPGQYRKTNVSLVKTNGLSLLKAQEIIRRCPPFEKIQSLMRSYQRDLEIIEKSKVKTRERLLLNHAYYDWIHPHIDGNGRNGRLALLWNSLRNLDELILIKVSKRKEYYDYLNEQTFRFDKKHKRILKS